jgi:hypothetical protein
VASYSGLARASGEGSGAAEESIMWKNEHALWTYAERNGGFELDEKAAER